MTTSRTRLTRARAKGSTDRDALDALLDSARVGHFALTRDDGHPVVLPTAIARDGDRVLVHGSTGAPWLRLLAGGAPTCLAVTELDGLVVARTAFESSMRYRSAVLFGRCSVVGGADKDSVVGGADKDHALDVITEALLPGRTAEVRRPNRKELDATLVLALPIDEWSLKISAKWPDDEPADVSGDAWAGIVPLETSTGTPRPAPDLRPGIPLPPSLA